MSVEISPSTILNAEVTEMGSAADCKADIEMVPSTAAAENPELAQQQTDAAAFMLDNNNMDLCRSCGKSNLELYDLFTTAAASQQTTTLNEEEEAAAAVVDNNALTNINTTSIINNNNNNNNDKKSINQNNSFNSSSSSTFVATTADDNKIDEINNSTATSANDTLTDAKTKATTTQGHNSNMEDIFQEMQIWQLRIKPNDGMPQRICSKCTAQFYMLHKFRRKCLKVQIRFRAMLEERRLEKEQQMLYNKDAEENLPAELGIGNDLVSDNYSQSLSEAELFESCYETDATLLTTTTDGDVSNINVSTIDNEEVINLTEEAKLDNATVAKVTNTKSLPATPRDYFEDTAVKPATCEMQPTETSINTDLLPLENLNKLLTVLSATNVDVNVAETANSMEKTIKNIKEDKKQEKLDKKTSSTKQQEGKSNLVDEGGECSKQAECKEDSIVVDDEKVEEELDKSPTKSSDENIQRQRSSSEIAFITKAALKEYATPPLMRMKSASELEGRSTSNYTSTRKKQGSQRKKSKVHNTQRTTKTTEAKLVPSENKQSKQLTALLSPANDAEKTITNTITTATTTTSDTPIATKTATTLESENISNSAETSTNVIQPPPVSLALLPLTTAQPALIAAETEINISKKRRKKLLKPNKDKSLLLKKKSKCVKLNESEDGSSQTQSCCVRLIRLRADRIRRILRGVDAKKTTPEKKSSASVENVSSKNASHRSNEALNYSNIEGGGKMGTAATTEQESKCLQKSNAETSALNPKDRIKATETDENAEVLRRSPWKTKAEMKESILNAATQENRIGPSNTRAASQKHLETRKELDTEIFTKIPEKTEVNKSDVEIYKMIAAKNDLERNEPQQLKAEQIEEAQNDEIVNKTEILQQTETTVVVNTKQRTEQMKNDAEEVASTSTGDEREKNNLSKETKENLIINSSKRKHHETEDPGLDHLEDQTKKFKCVPENKNNHETSLREVDSTKSESASKTSPESTNTRNMHTSAIDSLDVNIFNNKCDNNDNTLESMNTQMPSEYGKELPSELIVKVPLSALSKQFQNLHFSTSITAVTASKDDGESDFNTTTTTTPAAATKNDINFCISAAADCSDAAEAQLCHQKESPQQLDLNFGIETTNADVGELYAAEQNSICSQNDSDQSDFIGFQHESDATNESLNASIASNDATQNSIEVPRSGDICHLTASSKITDFINEFQTHCIDSSEFELEVQPGTPTASVADLALSNASYGGIASSVELANTIPPFHQPDLSLGAETEVHTIPPLPLLSATHLSEMNDVENTLNGILNEMQDEHIYTPVSGHADDFFTQSVYSPLSEHATEASTPSTHNNSYTEQSPAGCSSSACMDTSPYARRREQQGDTPIKHATNDEIFTSNFNTSYGECFTEDSTQSELIGFQNDQPCFGNIELAAAAAAATADNTNAAMAPIPMTSSPAGNPRLTRQKSNSALQGALPAKVITDSSNNVAFSATTSTTHNHADVYNAAQTTVPSTSLTAQLIETSFVDEVAAPTTETLQGNKDYAAAAADGSGIQFTQLLTEWQQQQQQQQQQTQQESFQQQTLLLNDSNLQSVQNNSGGEILNKLVNSSLAKVQFMPKTNELIDDTGGTTNAQPKLQFITLSTDQGTQLQLATTTTTTGNVVNVSSGGVAGGHLNLYTTANIATQQEVQWSNAGIIAEGVAPNNSSASNATTTTTYYINAADLYQSNIYTAAPATTISALTLEQQQQQATTMDLAKHSIDANENYIEGMQNQSYMIVIPQEYICDASGSNNASATAANTTMQEVFAHNSELNTTLTLTQAPNQTVLVQTTPLQNSNNLKNINNTNILSSINTSNTNAQFFATATSTPMNTPVSSPTTARRQSISPKTPLRNSPSQAQQQQQQIQAKTMMSPMRQPQQAVVEQKFNLTCRFCHKRPKFTSNLDYSNHIIAMHPAEAPYNCPNCPMHFTRRVKRQQHIVEEHGANRFQCAQCGQRFSAQRTLDLHLQRFHVPDSPQSSTQSAQCYMTSQQHRVDGGGGTAAWSPEMDNNNINAHQALVRVEDVHLRVTDEDKGRRSIDLQLDNNELSTEPSTSSSSASQTKNNNNTRILCCPDCDETLDDNSNSEDTHSHTHTSHSTHHHVTMPSPEQTEPDSTSTTTLRHFRKRRTSSAKFATALSPAASAAAAVDQMIVDRTLRNGHNCLFCEQHFTNEIALRKHHQLAHSNQNSMPFVCSICKRGFRMRTALQRHMETHDAEGRPYECTFCHVRFPRPSQLTLHKLTVHLQKKPHTCEECGKQFGTESALKTHAKFHGEREFECDICHRKFFLQKDLRKHRRIHTGERFYKCDLCPSSFLHYTRLRAHIRTHIPLGVCLHEDNTPVLTASEQQKDDEQIQLKTAQAEKAELNAQMSPTTTTTTTATAQQETTPIAIAATTTAATDNATEISKALMPSPMSSSSALSPLCQSTATTTTSGQELLTTTNVVTPAPTTTTTTAASTIESNIAFS